MHNRIDRQTAAARVRFVDVMQSEYPADRGIPELCRLLMRLSTTWRRLQIERRKKRSDNHSRMLTRVRYAKTIIKLCERFGDDGDDVQPEFHPREATITLTVPSGSTNDFARVGICLPAGRF